MRLIVFAEVCAVDYKLLPRVCYFIFWSLQFQTQIVVDFYSVLLSEDVSFCMLL